MKKENNKERITYSTYQIGKKTAVVCAIYKTENAANIKDTLLKLMESENKNSKSL